MANASALVSLTADRKNQGEVLGIEASVQALAQAVPGIIAGYVATLGVTMPVLVGGFIILAGGIIFAVFYRVPKAVDAKEKAGVTPINVEALID
jgi:DHA1 family tetracycline resistance protein-like MFS transporter